MLISERIHALKSAAEEIDRDARKPNPDALTVRAAVLALAERAVSLAEDMATQPLSPFVGPTVSAGELMP